MERQLQELARQLEALKKEHHKTKMAANFLIYGIVEALDAQGGDKKFSELLREKIEAELTKITMGGTSIPKYAINELMEPPVKIMFANQKPDPFLK